MKKKFFSVLLALVLVLTLGLVTAVPVAAAEPATLLSVSATDDPGAEDTITVEVPVGTTLGQIDSILWSVYLIEGYPPHVDIILDVNENGLVDLEDMLTAEMAYNNVALLEPDEGLVPTTGEWLQTFELSADDGYGQVDDNTMFWVTKMGAGNDDAPWGTLAEWKAGVVANDPGGDELAAGVIDGSAPVLRLEIEIDNWIPVDDNRVDHSSLVDNIVLVIAGDTVLVDMTASSPGEIIGISVSPTSVEFGSLVPGTVSADMAVTVTNEGNVAVDLDVTIENELPADFYTDNLTIAELAVSAWEAAGVAPAGTAEASPLVLTMPRGTPAGDYTATLVFWAIATQ